MITGAMKIQAKRLYSRAIVLGLDLLVENIYQSLYVTVFQSS